MKKSPLIYIIVAVSLVFGMWIGRFFSSPALNKNQNGINNPKIEKIADIFSYIEDNYVDSVDYETLVEDALQSILLHLDPHSSYIPLKDFALINEQMQGNFEGIGVQFNIVNDTIVVVQTIANGPSEKVGIRAGDRIVEVNDSVVAGTGITNNDVMRLLKGKKGTKVDLSILRKGVPIKLNFTIVRDVIPVYSVEYAGMLSKDIGYIKLSSFNLNSEKEFNNALKKLLNLGMAKLIFDLRGNGGGSLDVCINILDHFFPKNELLVYTQGLHRSRRDFLSSKGGLFLDGKLVVLIDEYSASASEIVAGAIQDNDRGIVIGRRTFGKGLVQEQIPFKDGSAIRLTVSRYYTPVGRSIQREYKNSLNAYYEDFYSRVMDEFEFGIDTTTYDTIEYKTKAGRVVYGGGGIMPDIHVSYPEIYKSNVINVYFSQIFQFSFDFADENREKLLSAYPNIDAFVKKFKINSNIWNQYIQITKDNLKDNMDKLNEVNLSDEERTFIEVHLKANIGRNLFGYDCYYPIIKDVDEMMNLAIEQLK